MNLSYTRIVYEQPPSLVTMNLTPILMSVRVVRVSVVFWWTRASMSYIW